MTTADPGARVWIVRAVRFLGALGIVFLTLLGLNHAWEMTLVGATLRYDPPLSAALNMLWIPTLVVAPVILALRMGRSAPRAWKIGLASLVLAYGTAVVHPAGQLLLGIADYVRAGSFADGWAGRMAAGRAIMRADPEQAARRALASGDTRLYMVNAIVIAAPGVRYSPRAEMRYGYKILPGFTEIEQIPEEAQYNSEAACWASRYNRVLAQRLDEVVVGDRDGCAREVGR